jgi:hypothetical protein
MTHVARTRRDGEAGYVVMEAPHGIVLGMVEWSGIWRAWDAVCKRCGIIANAHYRRTRGSAARELHYHWNVEHS